MARAVSPLGEMRLTDLPEDVLLHIMNLLVPPYMRKYFGMVPETSHVRQVLRIRGVCSQLLTLVDKKYPQPPATIDPVKHEVPIKHEEEIPSFVTHSQMDTKGHYSPLRYSPWLRRTRLLRSIHVPKFVSNQLLELFIENLPSCEYLTTLSFHSNLSLKTSWAQPLAACKSLLKLKVTNADSELLSVIEDPTSLPSLKHLSLLRFNTALSGLLFLHTLPQRYSGESPVEPPRLDTLNITFCCVRSSDDDDRQDEEKEEIENETKAEVNFEGSYSKKQGEDSDLVEEQTNNLPIPTFYEHLFDLLMPRHSELDRTRVRPWDSFVSSLHFLSVSHHSPTAATDRDVVNGLRLRLGLLRASGRLHKDACVSLGMRGNMVQLGASGVLNVNLVHLGFVRNSYLDVEDEDILFKMVSGSVLVEPGLSCISFRPVGVLYLDFSLRANLLLHLHTFVPMLRKIIWDGTYEENPGTMIKYLHPILTAFRSSIETIVLKIHPKQCESFYAAIRIKHLQHVTKLEIIMTHHFKTTDIIYIIRSIMYGMPSLRSFEFTEVRWIQWQYRISERFTRQCQRIEVTLLLENAIRDFEACFPNVNTESLHRILARRFAVGEI